MKNKKIFFGVYNPSIILTYIGVFCALWGIMVSFNDSMFNSADMYVFSMVALLAAGICDCFDGTIARACKRTEKEKLFGVQLDSLADVISFVAMPAIVTLNMCNMSWHAFIISCFYVFAGIMRLGWFNVTTEENKGFYQGLPVTFASVLFPTAYMIMRIFNILTYRAIVFEALCFVVGVLFISNFRIKKTGIVSIIIWCVAAIAIAVGLLCC